MKSDMSIIQEENFIEKPTSIRLKMAKVMAATVSGVATAEIVVPANRYIAGGSGWFVTHTPGDYAQIEVWHPQAGKVDSFTDELVPDANKGWWVPPGGKIDVGTLIADDAANIPAGLILKIIATKAVGEDVFYANLMWGERK